jgi:murein DD-endopeptidase MepM/ murein hydrolase activator NlpD
MTRHHFLNFALCTTMFLQSTITAFAQVRQQDSFGGIVPLKNDAQNPCIKPEEYTLIEKQCADNLKMLGLPTSAQHKTTSTAFAWPLHAATGFNDCEFYMISNYVDEDTGTTGIKDWHCGSITYDGHRGTDIATVPYPFYKMNNNQVEVVAAAPGTIINKVDGNFDRNCAMNSSTANYIVVQHADGSCALYWHMKKFSLTTKLVGQTVSTGEYLGVVGSSGNSTGPHLHFEVWSGTTANTLKDPYSGTCNILNAASWWTAQKSYTEPSMMKTQVNTNLAVFPACPATETPNDVHCFTPSALGRFYIFIRSETTGLTANMRVIGPSGATVDSWVRTSPSTYNFLSYYYFNRALPATAGNYTFEATYNGFTCSSKFTISCDSTTGIHSQASKQSIKISPNPFSNIITVTDDEEIGRVAIYNAVGNSIYDAQLQTKKQQIDLSIYPAGHYFLKAGNKSLVLVKE